MANVVGLEYVKPLLNVQGTVDDAVLESVVAQAEVMVVQRCGPLTATSLTKRVRARGGRLVLPVVPVISVTSVTAVESATAVDLTGTEDEVNLVAGIIKLSGARDGVAYDVVYQAGYSTTPEPLKRAVVEMTRYLFRPLQGPQVNNQVVDASMAALRMAEMLMQPYRMTGFA